MGGESWAEFNPLISLRKYLKTSKMRQNCQTYKSLARISGDPERGLDDIEMAAQCKYWKIPNAI